MRITRWATPSVMIVALTVLGAGTACDSSTAPTPVLSIVVTPATMNLYPQMKGRLVAEALDAGGASLTRNITWQSDQPAVASVDASGMVTAISAGTTGITATSGGVAGGAMITVLAPVHSVTLAPFAGTMVIGSTVQVTASLRCAAGNALQRPVTWTSDAPAVAAVDAEGIVTAIGAGVATISATSEGVTSTATVTVLAPVAAVDVEPPTPVILVGRTTQLNARVSDANGDLLSRIVTWTSTNPGIVTIDASGMLRGISPGITTVTAMSGGVVGAAVVTVLAPVSTIVVNLDTITLVTSGKQQLSATLYDANGVELRRPVTWTSDAPTVVSVSAAGLVTALTTGVARITAAVDALSATVTVTVVVPIASIRVEPPYTTANVGGTMQFNARILDADGNELTRPVTWASSNPAVASVSATGLVHAVIPGSTIITATSGGVVGSGNVTVLVPVASITLSPTSATIVTGETLLLTAVARDVNGQLLSRTITWSSDAPTIASVSASGLVTGQSSGTARITAAADYAFASASVTVGLPAASVDITLDAVTVDIGSTVPLTAVAKDTHGNAIQRPMTWTSSAPTVATVTPGGVVTGVSEGTADIIATADGRSDKTTVTVSPPLSSIVVTSSASTLTPEAPSATLTAVVYSQGNVVQRPVTWSSSNTSAVTVTPTGSQSATATLVGAGSVTISATAGGVSGSVNIEGKGPPTGGEEAANNLSWPVIFADGFTLLGDAVGTDAGLRPAPDEGILADTLPFWYHLNHADYQNTYYLQGGENTWRAEWLNGNSSPLGADVYWGDNLTHHAYNTHSVIHLEVGLFARGRPTMKGFNMFVLSGTAADEVVGADGTVGLFTPMLFTVHPRLVVEKIDAEGGNPLFTIVDKKLADGLGQDGPGYYRGELNKAGKVVYGYNLLIKDITVPEGQAKYGWYRLSFILEESVTVGGVSIPRSVSLDGLVAGDETDEPLHVPKLDPSGRRCYLDIYISSASGGHGENN